MRLHRIGNEAVPVGRLLEGLEDVKDRAPVAYSHCQRSTTHSSMRSAARGSSP
jgi:hypothetical protein